MYYVQNHLLGGFINDCYKTGKKKNVSEVDIEGTVRHPYAKGRSSTVTSRTLYRATEDLEPDTELLTSYDNLFRAIHIDCEDPKTAANRLAEENIAADVQQDEGGLGIRVADTWMQTAVQVESGWQHRDTTVTTRPARFAQVR